MKQDVQQKICMKIAAADSLRSMLSRRVRHQLATGCMEEAFVSTVHQLLYFCYKGQPFNLKYFKTSMCQRVSFDMVTQGWEGSGQG